MESPWDVRIENCLNVLGHMTMPVYGEKLKKSSSSEPIKRPMTLKLGIEHLVLEYYHCFHMETLG